MSEGVAELLILVVAANSTPVLLARILGPRWAFPVDAGRRFIDGRRLLGDSKTWRGIAGAVAVTALLAPLLGYDALTGAIAGALAMLGDALSSFSKRRLGLQSSAQAPLLDQVPESLLPAIVLRAEFALSWLDVALVSIIFLVIEVVFSKVFYYLGVRKRPY